MFKDAKEIKEFYKKTAANLVDYYRIACYEDTNTNYLPPAKFHYQISDILLNKKNNFAIEAFRESGKTSLCINAFVSYKLTYGQFEQRNTYIILIKKTATLASEKIREIKERFYSNPILNVDVKQIVRDTNTEGGVLEVEYNNGARCRIEGCGKGSSVRGAVWRSTRPQIVILDDVQSLEDVYSETTIEKDWKWFVREIAFLGKKSRIFFIGNNLGSNCLIERVIREADTLNFETLKIPVRTPDGELAWEAKYNNAEIDSIIDKARKNNTLDDVYSELFCECMAEQSRRFRRSFFREYYMVDLPKILATSNIYVTCDLAATITKSADYSAIMVTAVNPDAHRFIVDCIYGRMDETEILDNIFALVTKYKPKKVGLEKTGFQRLWGFILQREMGKRNKFFEIAECTALGEKEQRQAAVLLPLFKNGYIWFPETADWRGELEAELLAFPNPNGKNDLLDALTMVEQIQEPPSDNSFEDIRWEMTPKIAENAY